MSGACGGLQAGCCALEVVEFQRRLSAATTFRTCLVSGAGGWGWGWGGNVWSSTHTEQAPGRSISSVLVIIKIYARFLGYKMDFNVIQLLTG